MGIRVASASNINNTAISNPTTPGAGFNGISRRKLRVVKRDKLGCDVTKDEKNRKMGKVFTGKFQEGTKNPFPIEGARKLCKILSKNRG